MTRDEIDVMWQQALHQSVQDGEQFTRYRFAALVAAKEREECAKVCEERAGGVSMFATSREAANNNKAVRGCAAAIRARKP